MLNASLKDLLRQHCLLPEYSAPFSHMRFGVFTCESHQDLGIFAYVQPLYSHLCLLSHTCEYLLSYENRCWCDHKYFNISESVKFFKVLISVPKLDRKAWIFPTFFFVKILKFSKKSHICEAQEPHMWLYSHMWVRTVSLTECCQWFWGDFNKYFLNWLFNVPDSYFYGIWYRKYVCEVSEGSDNF